MAGDKRTVATKPVMLAVGNDTSGEGSPFQKAALVVNTRSRSGETAFDVAAKLLPKLGVPLAVMHALAEPRRLPEVVGGALRAGCDLIVVGGGDGSISCVVDLLAHHDAALGVLPVGTANNFARTLGIPFEIEQACETVASGALVDVDVDLGLVGSDYYVNVASVGLSAAVARGLASGLKRRLGALAYPTAAARATRPPPALLRSSHFPGWRLRGRRAAKGTATERRQRPFLRGRVRRLARLRHRWLYARRVCHRGRTLP